MKKIILLAFLVVFTWNALPLSAKENAHYRTTARVEQSEAAKLEARLYEIREMTKKELSKEEKSALREEVLEIRKRVSDPLGGGVYISAGALILIIILLIILL